MGKTKIYYRKNKNNKTKRRQIKSNNKTKKSININKVNKTAKKVYGGKIASCKKHDFSSNNLKNEKINEEEMMSFLSAQLSSIIYYNDYQIYKMIDFIKNGLKSPQEYFVKIGNQAKFNEKLISMNEESNTMSNADNNDTNNDTNNSKNVIEDDILESFDLYIDTKLNNKLMIVIFNIKLNPDVESKKYLFIVAKGTNNKQNVLDDLDIAREESDIVKTIEILNPETFNLDRFNAETIPLNSNNTTTETLELNNFSFKEVESEQIKVHRGFKKYARNSFEGILQDKLTNLIEQKEKEADYYSFDGKIIFTGHSLGAAIISILAINYCYAYLKTRLGENKINKDVYVYTFGCPNYISNSHFTNTKIYKGTDIYPFDKVINYINEGDIVPLIPPKIYSRYGLFINQCEIKDYPAFLKINEDKLKKLVGIIDHSYYLGTKMGGLKKKDDGSKIKNYGNKEKVYITYDKDNGFITSYSKYDNKPKIPKKVGNSFKSGELAVTALG